jgi:aspartate beta-hydroxylase
MLPQLLLLTLREQRTNTTAASRGDHVHALAGPRASAVEPRLLQCDEVLIKRHADIIPHARWSLRQHLLGTFRILEQWNESADVQLAGVLHSVYSTDVFGTRLFARDERELVCDLVGRDAERLIYLFCFINRRRIFETIDDVQFNDGTIAFEDREDAQQLDVSFRELRDLSVIHMANAAEQHCAADGSPSVWLASASRMARAVRSYPAVPAPVFDGCSAIVSVDDERRLLEAYADALRNHGDTTEKEAELRSAAHAVPWVGEPWVWLGLLALSRGDVEKAAAHGARAAQTIQQWNAAWDKRLSEVRWLTLADLLVRAGNATPEDSAFIAKRVTALLRSSVAKPEGVFAQLDAFDALGTALLGDAAEVSEQGVLAWRLADLAGAEEADFEDLPSRFCDYIAGLRATDNESMASYPGLSATPWWNAKEFALASELERMAPQIIEEFCSIDRRDFQPESEPIERRGNWSVFFLFERGLKNERNCALVPTATSIIEAHRTVRDMRGLAYFSRMAPGSTIAAHRGPTNMRLRCHLGIDVPDDCGIMVNGISKCWSVGECLVFDDSFAHETWNYSKAERIVLIVDLWHPELSDDEVALLGGMHRHIASNAEGLHRYWRRNALAAEAPLVD